MLWIYIFFLGFIECISFIAKLCIFFLRIGLILLYIFSIYTCFITFISFSKFIDGSSCSLQQRKVTSLYLTQRNEYFIVISVSASFLYIENFTYWVSICIVLSWKFIQLFTISYANVNLIYSFSKPKWHDK